MAMGPHPREWWRFRASMKTSADYPQYFALPENTKGRYVRITGIKLKDEPRMQFTEIEVYGRKNQEGVIR